MQSSSAMIGLVIMMAGSGAITMGDALFVIIGANVGTCFTSMLAIIGSSTNAKRTGFMHLTVKLIGAVLFTIIVWIFKNQIQDLLNNTGWNPEFQIAVFHVVFNVITTAILLPFIKYLVKFIEHIVPDKPNELAHTLKFIDHRELRTPAIAVMQVKKEIENMANLAKENLEKGFYEVCNQEGKYDEEIEKRENAIDYINAEVTNFLIKLSPLVTGSNLEQVGSYYHVINDIERIGDHAENLLKDAQHMHEQGIKFSSVAEAELKTMFDTIEQMFAIAIKTFDTSIDVDLKELSELESKTDDLKHQLSISHFERLAQENCTMELGGYFTSIISGLERVGDHLVNIGYSIQDPTGNQNERTDNYNFYWE
jgi:phosphate:Na+ symporter